MMYALVGVGNWSVDQGLIQPDAQDPPELQFYRIRPFYVGNTSRLAAHVFTYATQPPQSIVGEDYGLQPSACSPVNDKKWAKMPPFKPYNPRCENGGCCHGPHLFEEWWIGPHSGDAADTRGWRRPFRSTHGAPHDEPLMAQPVPFDNMASSLPPPSHLQRRLLSMSMSDSLLSIPPRAVALGWVGLRIHSSC